MNVTTLICKFEYQNNVVDIVQGAIECVEYMKELEINDDQVSRNLYQKKIKQFENK